MKINEKNINLNGSMFLKTIFVSFNILVDIFGEPKENNNEKNKCIWDIKFNDNTLASIYDWKTNEKKENIIEWNIGGFDQKAIKLINEKINDYLIQKFNSEIEKVKSFYNEENIKLPNDFTFSYMKKILKTLYKPFKISPSIEEGIALVFKNKNRMMWFEIYNDGDAEFIIENEKNIDITTLKESIAYIKKFYEN